MYGAAGCCAKGHDCAQGREATMAGRRMGGGLRLGGGNAVQRRRQRRPLPLSCRKCSTTGCQKGRAGDAPQAAQKVDHHCDEVQHVDLDGRLGKEEGQMKPRAAANPAVPCSSQGRGRQQATAQPWHIISTSWHSTSQRMAQHSAPGSACCDCAEI